MSLITKIRKPYERSALFRLLNPRRTHLYCVGTAKSGTHSIAAVFGDELRSVHEADSESMISLILDAAEGRASSEQVRRYIRCRDRRLWLEIDSSQLNYFILDDLVQLFPHAKFVLTIRDPYSWVDSLINHQLSRKATENWKRLRDYRFGGRQHPARPFEEPLRKGGLHSLDGYFAYWASHNQTVLSTVLANRLLVVRTDRISQETERIARFAGVPARATKRELSHAFQAKDRYGVLSELDPSYLQEKVDIHCGELVREYFPDLGSAELEVRRLHPQRSR